MGRRTQATFDESGLRAFGPSALLQIVPTGTMGPNHLVVAGIDKGRRRDKSLGRVPHG